METKYKQLGTTGTTSKAWLLFLLFLLGSIWGLHFSIIKIAAESGLAYSGIAAITTFGVFSGLTAIALARWKFPRWNRSTILFYFVCGILGYVAPFLIELAVARHLTAGLLTLIVATAPVWTILIAVLARVEKVSPRQTIGIIIGLCSVVILLIPDTGVTDIIPGSGFVRHPPFRCFTGAITTMLPRSGRQAWIPGRSPWVRPQQLCACWVHCSGLAVAGSAHLQIFQAAAGQFCTWWFLELSRSISTLNWSALAGPSRFPSQTMYRSSWVSCGA